MKCEFCGAEAIASLNITKGWSKKEVARVIVCGSCGERLRRILTIAGVHQ